LALSSTPMMEAVVPPKLDELPDYEVSHRKRYCSSHTSLSEPQMEEILLQSALEGKHKTNSFLLYIQGTSLHQIFTKDKLQFV
jgi:hypothetical protein